MAASSTTKLLNTVEWAKKLNFNRPLAIGDFLEPAITSANIIAQTIMGAPFRWRWNRVVTGFIAVAGQQDYTVFNWAASTAIPVGYFTVDTYGNSQIVTTAGTTGTTTPSWSNTVGANTQDGSVVWKNQGNIGASASPTYSLAWIETSSVKDLNDSKWRAMESLIGIEQASESARPRFLSAQSDDGQGNVTFRLLPVPDQAYPVSITLQKKPLIFTGLNQSWAPIPDEYAHIYNWGFLALMWMFADDNRFQLANQKFVTQLLGANSGLTDTQMNIFLNNWQAITGQPTSKSTAQQQGFQSRGV